MLTNYWRNNFAYKPLSKTAAWLLVFSLVLPNLVVFTPIRTFADAMPSLPVECSGVIGDYTLINFTAGDDNGDIASGNIKHFIFAGNSNNDNVDGLGGDDCILIGDNNTGNIQGGDGNDTIIAGENNDDKIEGENGNDTIIVGENNDGEVHGGADNDTITVGDNNGSKITGNGGNDSIGVGNDNDGEILGSTGDDTITVGDNNLKSIKGEAGNDSITVGGNNDGEVLGGTDNDTIIIGTNNQKNVKGDEGDDQITIGNNNEGQVLGGNDDDTIIIGDSNGGDVKGESGNDEITIGFDNAGEVKGGNNNDTINVGDSNSGYLKGESGDDVIIAGNNGNGAGIDGGSDNDVCSYGTGYDEADVSCESENFVEPDSINPVVIITSPEDESTHTEGAVISIQGTIVDDNPDFYLVTISGPSSYSTTTGNIDQSGSISSATTLFAWDTSGLVAGPYIIELFAEDDYGNTSSVSVDITLNAEVLYGMISGVKYYDDNGNGERNDGEQTIDGWAISVYDGSWALLQTENTGAVESGGVYVFEALEYGNYYVCEEAREGWNAIGPAGNTLNEELEGGDAYCVSVTIDGAEEVDFGNFEDASISGTKWNDENEDGIFDEDESGISGWEIYLFDGSATTTIETDEEGDYTFEGLLPGNYRICEEDKGAWQQSFPETSNGCYADVLIDESADLLTGYDFGNFELPPTSISGYKWSEQDEVEGFNEGEGLAGWTITLWLDESTSVSTTTDTNGFYKFTGIELVEYEVCEENRAGWMRLFADELCDTVEVSELGIEYANVNFQNELDGEEDELDIPALISPANNSYISGSEVEFIWGEIAEASEYLFNLFDSENLSNLVEVDDSSYGEESVNGLSEGDYFWRVRAVNEDDETGPWSSVFKFTIDNTAPTSLFTSPNEGTDWLDKIDVNGNSNDNNNVDFVTLSFAVFNAVGEGEQTPENSCGEFTTITQVENTNLATVPFVWEYDWTPASVGDYCIKASATDLAGNAEASPVVMNVSYDGATPTPPSANSTKW